MSMTIVIGALQLGGIFAILSLGIFVSFKVLNLPDLTVDSSFTLGCSLSAVMTLLGYPYLGIVMAFIGGCLAGSVTGFLITKIRIMPILSGILVMSGLYSINLKVMNDTPMLSLFGIKTVFNNNDFDQLLVICMFLILVFGCLYYLLKTQLGLALRACGDNEDMVRASSIDTDKMKIFGLAIANGIVALSGGIFAQYQTFADIQSGTGMMVIGLASIIVGMTFIKTYNLCFQLLSVIIGAVFYRFVLTFALQLGLPSSDLKLLSSLIVVIAIASTHLKRGKKRC